MDGDRAAAVELAQPAHARRRMERPLEFNLFRSTPIVLYTMQNEEYVLPSVGDTLRANKPTPVPISFSFNFGFREMLNRVLVQVR
jgi:hypothetical protein